MMQEARPIAINYQLKNGQDEMQNGGNGIPYLIQKGGNEEGNPLNSG
jgi:hypothetical protein